MLFVFKDIYVQQNIPMRQQEKVRKGEKFLMNVFLAQLCYLVFITKCNIFFPQGIIKSCLMKFVIQNHRIFFMEWIVIIWTQLSNLELCRDTFNWASIHFKSKEQNDKINNLHSTIASIIDDLIPRSKYWDFMDIQPQKSWKEFTFL